MKILKKYNDVKTYIKRVSDEADHHKHCFGFLAASIYEQLAKKDSLNTPTLLNLSAHRVNEFSYNQPINLYRKYVIDINILLDFIIKREHTEQAQELIKGSLGGVYKLAVTPEAHVEIERNAKSLDPLAMLVANIPSLPMLENIEKTQEYQALKQLVFPKIDFATKASTHKISDLKHLAYCILNKCTGFITGDQHLLKKANSLYAEFGIEIISPEEFIINEEDNPNNDTIISLDDLNYKFVTVSEDSYSLNECLSDLEVSREIIQLPAFEGIVVKQETKTYLACALWSKAIIGNRDAVAYIFSKNLGNNELFDHIIETIFRMVKSKKVSSIAIFTQGLISHIDKVLIHSTNYLRPQTYHFAYKV